MKKQRVALALSLMLFVVPSFSCGAGLTVMSYNVENLFDDVRDGTEYPEFDPSRGKWSTELFNLRVDTIAEVVRKSVPGGPDILLLQEVENENAVHVLVNRGLAGLGYAWIAFVPKRGLSANLAIVSRIPMQSVHAWAVAPWKGTTPLRDILEAEIKTEGHLLHVLDNHWKAKTEGTRVTEQSRRESASVLVARIRELLAQDPLADIIAAGDFNENLDEFVQIGRKYQTALLTEGEGLRGLEPLQSIFLAGNLRGMDASAERCVLYDPWFEVDPARRGSYYYQKRWLTFDHILLSPGLFDKAGFSYLWGSFAPVRLAFLMTPDGIPRKWKGVSGERGYSDHLPLLLALDVKK